MSPDTREGQIQDYLDGRLSEAERAAFEKRLQREPDLARRVADDRRIGDALREEPPALSPGFYTRTRARFEAGARRPRRGFRLLSWETAGLSAAVVLAAAIFLPGMLRRDDTYQMPLQDAPVEESPSQPAAPPTADDDEMPKPASRMKKELTEDVRRSEGFAPAPPPEEPKARADKKGKADVGATELKRVVADAPEPVPEAAMAEAAPVTGEPELEQETAGRGQLREADRLEAASEIRANLEGAVATFETVPLRAGTVEPGAVQILTDEEARQRLEVSKNQVSRKRSAAAPPAGAFRDEATRVVLIGARPGLYDCSSVSVEVSEVAYIVRISPGREGEKAGPDCAILFPRDDREILVMESGADD